MRELSRLMGSMSKATRTAETSSLQHKQVRGTEGEEGLGDSPTEWSTEEGESEGRGEDHTETARQGGDKEAQEVLLVQGELGGRETQQRGTGEGRQGTTPGEPLLFYTPPCHASGRGGGGVREGGDVLPTPPRPLSREPGCRRGVG